MFKPIDEEAYAPNNPRGYEGKLGQQSFRSGVLSGEGAVREVCAYILDKDHFSGVPPTTLVEIAHSSFKNAISFNSSEENILGGEGVVELDILWTSYLS